MNKWSKTFTVLALVFVATPSKSRSLHNARWYSLVGLSIANFIFDNNARSNLEEKWTTLPDIDQFKEEVKNTPGYHELTENQRNLMDSAYIRKLIGDDSVIVKYDPDEGLGAFAYRGGILTDKKFIKISGINIHPSLCEGILLHEYEHIRKRHDQKKMILSNIAPLTLHIFFKGFYSGYKLVRYGYLATKNMIPSMQVNLLNLLTTIISFPMIKSVTFSSISRAQEWQADNEVSPQYAADMADNLEALAIEYNKQYQPLQPQFSFFKWVYAKIHKTHPPVQDRIKELRYRAKSA